jgi:hypothetical protein
MKEEMEKNHMLLNKAEDLTAWSSRCVLQKVIQGERKVPVVPVGSRM